MTKRTLGKQRAALYFADNQSFENSITDASMDAIITAYKYQCCIESSRNKLGAEELSPLFLAEALYHRTIRLALEGVLRLLAVDSRDYDLEDFIKKYTSGDAPDMSLILKSEKAKES